jgi:alpha-L-rhamnosidase
MARQLADVAELLGKQADAQSIDAWADTVRTAYNEALYRPAQKLYSRTGTEYRQTDNIVPLIFGLAPQADRAAICENLKNDVEVAWDGHLDTGAVGTKWILPALTDCGYVDLANRVATNPTYPGWGWWFQTVHGYNNGAETFIVDGHWEAWCWFGARTAANCAFDPARSHNHAFRGTVDDWLFEYVAGIKRAAPAYRAIEIKPVPVGDLDHASAHTTTPLGRVSSAWTRSDRKFRLKVTVPVGATATVHVPSGGRSVDVDGRGAKRVGSVDGHELYEVGSGEYRFTATGGAA